MSSKNFGKVLAASAIAAMAFAVQANAHPDSLVLTPPMGWNSWNVFHENINEKQIKEIADAMVSSGLRDAGYIYLNLDDNWMHTKRDAQGRLQNHPTTFPSGMKALADYVHEKGLKFGLYGDRGKRTCHHYNSKWDSENGSYMREEIDAKTFAEWGVDYLKYDNCDPAPNSNQEDDYRRMSKALRNSGRDIVFSICAWGYQKWMPEISHLWRSTFDIGPEWVSTSWYRGIYDIIDANNKYWEVARPGHWNDPDMLEVDNKGVSYEESRSQMTMWSIMAAPIMISSDVRKMSNEIKELYLNKEMIAVNQDSLGVQGHRISKKDGKEIWTKPLQNGDIAVALLNSGNSTQTIECNFADIGVTGEVEVRDIWKKKDLGALSHVSAEIPAHGSVMLRLITKPVPRAPFKAKAFAIPGKIEMEDFDINGVGKGNTTYNETDTENHGASDYRKADAPSVDLYEKSGDRIVVGYIQEGEWLEYTVSVKETGTYTMFAAVASDGGSSFKLSMDGENITEALEVPAAKKEEGAEQNFDDYNKVKANVNLTKGEHILRFTALADWFDIDYINFVAGENAKDDAPIAGKDDSSEEDSTTVIRPAIGVTQFTELAGMNRSVEVFSLTGKLIGRVNVLGNGMAETLKNAGFAKGAYMVRDIRANKMQRVNVK